MAELKRFLVRDNGKRFGGFISEQDSFAVTNVTVKDLFGNPEKGNDKSFVSILVKSGDVITYKSLSSGDIEILALAYNWPKKEGIWQIPGVFPMGLDKGKILVDKTKMKQIEDHYAPKTEVVEEDNNPFA